MYFFIFAKFTPSEDSVRFDLSLTLNLKYSGVSSGDIYCVINSRVIYGPLVTTRAEEGLRVDSDILRYIVYLEKKN